MRVYEHSKATDISKNETIGYVVPDERPCFSINKMLVTSFRLYETHRKRAKI